MHILLTSAKFTNRQLKNINHVRKYLGVERISCMASSRGDIQYQCFYTGDNDNPPTFPMEININQDRPTEASWKDWRDASAHWVNANSGKLHKQLGRWIAPPKQMLRVWRCYRTKFKARVRNPTGRFDEYTYYVTGTPHKQAPSEPA